ncbi:MAG: hypothetical protein HY986_05225 [Candidatus Melainabacteria bacterium]|nr:hypothetical protein [Candidatus Melainabacteria bacterium]
MKHSVISIIKTQEQAISIIDALKRAGFVNSDISMLMPDRSGVRDMGHEQHSKAPEGTSTGAGAGALIGGALGWLAGLGALAIPGIGPLVVAGPIVAALTGVGIGATTGGITGGLIGLGIPEYEAKQYEGKIREGNILLSVHTEKPLEIKLAKEIFKTGGGNGITSTDEAVAGLVK